MRQLDKLDREFLRLTGQQVPLDPLDQEFLRLTGQAATGPMPGQAPIGPTRQPLQPGAPALPQSQPGAPTPEPYFPPATVGPDETIRGRFLAESAAQGVMQGSLDLVTMASELVNRATEYGLGTVHPGAASWFAKKFPPGAADEAARPLRNFLAPRSLEAQNNYEKITGRAMELAGASVIPTEAAYALAGRFSSRGKNGMTALRGLMLDLAQQNPNQLIALESALGGVAGAAGGATSVATDNTTAQLFAELVAGIGFPAATSFVSSAARTFSARRAFRRIPKPEAEKYVGRYLDTVMSNDPQALERLSHTADEFRALGLDEGNIPDIGQLSGDPGLARTISRQRQRLGLEGEEIERQSALDLQLQGKLASEVPGVPKGGRPGALRELAEGREGQVRLAEDATLRAQTELDTARINQIQSEMLAGTQKADLNDLYTSMVDDANRRVDDAIRGLGDEDITFERKVGEVLQREFNNEKATLAERVSPHYKRLAQEYGQQPVDVGGVQNFTDELIATADPVANPENIPGLIRRLASDDEFQTGTVSFQRLNAVRREVLADQRQLRAAATPNPEAERHLGNLLDEIDVAIDKFAAAGEIPGFRELQAFYRAGKTRLSQGRAAAVQRHGQLGKETAIDISATASKFLYADSRAGAYEAMDEFQRAFGGQPGVSAKVLPEGGISKIPLNQDAHDAMVYHLRQSARRAAQDPDTGKFLPDRLRAWVANRRVQLSFFPKLKKEMEDIAGFARQVESENKILAARKQVYEREIADGLAQGDRARVATARRSLAEARAAERDVRSDFTKSVFGDMVKRDPSDIAKSVLDARNPITRAKETLRAVRGNREAEEGFKRALWDEIIDRVRGPQRGPRQPGVAAQEGRASRHPLLNEQALRDALDQHGDLLMEVYQTPTQRTYVEVLADIVGANPPRTPGGSTGIALPDQEFNQLAQLISRMVSRVYSYQRGVISGRYLVTEQVARVFSREIQQANTELVDHILSRALYDPDYATRLIGAAREKTPRALQKRLRTFLVAEQARYNRQREGAQ